MKTRLYILLAIIRIIDINLYAQDISVGFSIIWIEKQCVYKSDSLVYYPMLRMSYTNNSNDNYYFRKFSHDKNGLKYQGCYELSQYGEIDTSWNYANYLREMECKKLFENQEYLVNIELPYLDYGYWYIVDDSYDNSQETMISDINCVISNINDCINKYVINNSDYNGSNKTFFTSSKVTKRNVKGNMKDQFMFLKAGESKEELYNLTSFYMVKGTYTFLIKEDHFKDFVINNVGCEGVKSVLPLPKKVGKYKLYSGKFTANTLTVTF